MTEPAAPPLTSYDSFPYESHAFFETHPDHLATQATLFGLRPPPVAGCRVLEIGCAAGGNLIPMALGMPSARFVGVDLSSRQIADGRAQAERFGLTNLDLRAMDLAAIGPDLGTFDYIICHGVYSWVPPAAQDAILALCRRALTPGGVAFVSFNVLPGWHERGMVREMMLYHVAAIADPAEKARAARVFLDDLIAAIPKSDETHARQVGVVAESIRKQGDFYLLHEYLEAENHPCYFADFVARAAGHGLRWMTEARFRTLADQQPEETRRALHRLAPDDAIRREQYHDFLRNRTFRRALLVHDDQQVRPAGPEALTTLRARTLAGPVSPTPEAVLADGTEEFRSIEGKEALRTNNRLLKMALLVLCECWPRSMPVVELREEVARRLPEADGGELRAALFECYCAGLLDLTTFEPRFVAAAGLNPEASVLALDQAERGSRVTSLRHRVVELSDFERLVLRQLDGTRDRAEILDSLVAEAVAGRFLLHQGGDPIRDPMVARPILGRSLEPCLARLASSALLVG